MVPRAAGSLLKFLKRDHLELYHCKIESCAIVFLYISASITFFYMCNSDLSIGKDGK